MKSWYVVETQSRAEEKALFHLERQSFDAYLPRYLKMRRHARRTDWRPVPLFPRYLFVNIDVRDEVWRPIHSTVGVTRLVSHGEMPTPVPIGIVEDIRAREDGEGLVTLGAAERFKKGDPVRIKHGAFDEHIGIFDCLDDNERVFILLNLMGREVKIQLPADAVTDPS